MPIRDIADLERRIRRLEMERDQSRHKLIVPERSVNAALPSRVEVTTSADMGVWQSWTPTITYTGGSGTPTSLSTVARYCKIGKLVHIYISATVVRGSCTQAYINFTMPTAAARRFTAFGVHTIITADWKQGMGLGNAGTPGQLYVSLGGAMARDGNLWVSAFYEET